MPLCFAWLPWAKQASAPPGHLSSTLCHLLASAPQIAKRVWEQTGFFQAFCLQTLLGSAFLEGVLYMCWADAKPEP